MNILFICSKNKWRSRTAETIFKDNGQHVVRSAGTEASARIRVNQKDINWADKIYVMELKHEYKIRRNFTLTKSTKLEVLGIPDDYPYMNSELIEILKTLLSHEFTTRY